MSQLSVQLQRDVGAVPDGHRLIQLKLIRLIENRPSPVEPLERSQLQPIEVRVQRKRAVVCGQSRQDAQNSRREEEQTALFHQKDLQSSVCWKRCAV